MDQEALADCANELFAIVQERKGLKKAFDKSDNVLKERASELTEDLIQALGKPKGIRSLKTDLVTATFSNKKVYNPKKWDEIYKYIKKHGAWDLLSKKLSSKAVALRLEESGTKHIALRKAVEPFQKKSISLTTVKK